MQEQEVEGEGFIYFRLRIHTSFIERARNINSNFKHEYSNDFKIKSKIKKSILYFDTQNMYMGSSTETVAFQVYEILKIDHEFLQLF